MGEALTRFTHPRIPHSYLMHISTIINLICISTINTLTLTDVLTYIVTPSLSPMC
jgi:hypothetical protein